MGGDGGRLNSGTHLSSQHRWKQGSHEEWGSVSSLSHSHISTLGFQEAPHTPSKSSALVRTLETRVYGCRGETQFGELRPTPYLPAQVSEADVQLMLLAGLPLVSAAVLCR